MTLTPLTTVLSQESSAAYAHLGHHGSGTKNLLFAVLTDAHIHINDVITYPQKN